MLFVQVIEAGSLTKAAVLMSCSKSQISRKLAKLESRLNVQLVIKQQQGLILTEEGNEFYQSCVKIHSDFKRAIQSTQKSSLNVTGKLCITAPLNLGAMTLCPLIADFMQKFPKLTVDLDLSDGYKEILDGPLDVAIRIASELSQPGLVAKKLHAYKNIICASKAYISEHGVPTSPWDLSQHKIISALTNLIGEKPGHWGFIEHGQSLDVPIYPFFKVANHKVQKQMAVDGCGIIRVPEYSIDQEIEQGELVPLLECYNLAELHVFAVYKKLDPVPKKIQLFIHFLQQYFTMPP